MHLPCGAGSREGVVAAWAWAQEEAGCEPGVGWSGGRREEGKGVGSAGREEGLEGGLAIWKEATVTHQQTSNSLSAPGSRGSPLVSRTSAAVGSEPLMAGTTHFLLPIVFGA